MANTLNHSFFDYALYTAASTGGETFYSPTWENKYGLTKSIVTLYIANGGTAAGAALSVKLQGAPTDATAQYTVVKCWATGATSWHSPIAGNVDFTLKTAGYARRFVEFLPPRLRAVYTINGSATRYTFGLSLTGTEDA